MRGISRTGYDSVLKGDWLHWRKRSGSSSRRSINSILSHGLVKLGCAELVLAKKQKNKEKKQHSGTGNFNWLKVDNLSEMTKMEPVWIVTGGFPHVEYLMVEFKSGVPKLFPSEGQNRNVKQTATASYLNRVQNGARNLKTAFFHILLINVVHFWMSLTTI